MALAASANLDAKALAALRSLAALNGCQAHCSVILSSPDESTYKSWAFSSPVSPSTRPTICTTGKRRLDPEAQRRAPGEGIPSPRGAFFQGRMGRRPWLWGWSGTGPYGAPGGPGGGSQIRPPILRRRMFPHPSRRGGARPPLSGFAVFRLRRCRGGSP